LAIPNNLKIEVVEFYNNEVFKIGNSLKLKYLQVMEVKRSYNKENRKTEKQERHKE
jgi:hypothetical protein